MTARQLRPVLFAGFVATVYLANWLTARHGLVPVGLGLTATAGTYLVGLSFGLRDALHEVAGWRWVLAAIAAGCALAYVLEDAITLPGGHVPLAVASAVAFGVSELLDLAVYAPLRERAWPAAVVASNAVGLVADSLLFLWLALGTLHPIAGQVVGKAWLIAAAVVVVGGVRRRAHA